MSDENLPVAPFAELGGSLPVSLQIFFNDALFERCKAVSHYIAKAEGMAPRHLLGKPEACFAVVSRALTWRLDPYAVAMATYSTPSGQVGFYGSLCQAIIENSGRLLGGVKFEHYGNWDALRGKFRIVTSEKGSKYPAPDWKPEDEAGLGVIVSAQIKDEAEPRTMRFDLVQAFPRNSTLWATDPRTQIQYTAVRRFATSTVPTLFMGIPFDSENIDELTMRDVTPPRPEEDDTPRRRRGRQAAEAKPTPQTNGAKPPEDTVIDVTDVEEAPFFFSDQQGEVHDFTDVNEAVTAYTMYLEFSAKDNLKALQAAWENGAMFITALREHQQDASADELGTLYASLADALDRKPEPDAAVVQPDYSVVVPMPDGMPANQWHMAARDKLKQMTEAGRPPEDYKRFREANHKPLTRLHTELRSWFNMIDKEITRGATAPPA